MARNIMCGTQVCVVEGFETHRVVGSGSFETMGWDIPTYWAVLEGGIVLASNGHGSYLERAAPSHLLNDAKDNPDVVIHIRKALGMKPPLPTWVRLARQNGWTPPEGWDESRYDAS